MNWLSALKSHAELLACIIVAVLVFGAGCQVEAWRKDAQIAELRREEAKAREAAAEDWSRRLTIAQARGDTLTSQLQAREADIDQLSKEKEDVLHRLTTGRRCLDGAAVRVLNAQPAPTGPAAVSAPATEPDAADAAFATDSDVGEWILTCQRAYGTCRQRFDALIDYFGPDDD